MVDDRTDSPSRVDPVEDWNQFLGVGLAFLAFEAVILFILGGPLLGDSDSTLLFLVIAGLGAVGYLLLGMQTAAWLSVLFIPLPIVLAVAVGGSVADGSSASEIPLYVSWAYLSVYFFGPAWLLGLLVSLVRREYPGGRA